LFSLYSAQIVLIGSLILDGFLSLHLKFFLLPPYLIQRHEKLLHVAKKETIKEETYMTVVLTSEELRIEVLRLRLIMGSCDFRELHIFSMHGKLSCFNFFKKKIFCFSHGGIEVWAS